MECYLVIKVEHLLCFPNLEFAVILLLMTYGKKSQSI
jgi:hypothetical protein